MCDFFFFLGGGRRALQKKNKNLIHCLSFLIIWINIDIYDDTVPQIMFTMLLS